MELTLTSSVSRDGLRLSLRGHSEPAPRSAEPAAKGSSRCPRHVVWAGLHGLQAPICRSGGPRQVGRSEGSELVPRAPKVLVELQCCWRGLWLWLRVWQEPTARVRARRAIGTVLACVRDIRTGDQHKHRAVAETAITRCHSLGQAFRVSPWALPSSLAEPAPHSPPQ